MKRLLFTLAAVLVCFVASAQTSLPMDKGLPVVVKAAIAYVEIGGFDENASTFVGTVDVRLRWEDLRQRRPAEEAKDPPRVFRGEAALAQVKQIWAPSIEVANRIGGDAGQADLGLRIFPDGRVELTRRVTGEFNTVYDVSRFPFGKQQLQVRLITRDLTSSQLSLAFDQDDLDFSRPAATAALDGWNLRFVNLRVDPLSGWYGASQATATASLEVVRDPGSAIASIFVPLLASLLIPLLALWLNRLVDGRFQIESYELVNLTIGGLFAVIALNFTVNSVYQVLETGDNPVNRLFALNYVALAVSLAVNVVLIRFRVVEHAFGRYVQEQLYIFLMWAIPLLVLIAAASFILVAIA